MRVGSLFSGIGGLDHGLHRAGHEHVFFCESDPWRREVLRTRWPGVPVYDDVRNVARRDGLLDGDGTSTAVEGGERSAPAVDLLCGGFPCQDLSVAGKRAGLSGERSGLFFEYARIIDAVRPRWVLIENVPGLLSSNGGRDFGVVLGTLAELGYGVGWRIVDSRFFGVPQRRRRVFVVGAVVDGDPRDAAGRAGAVLAVGSRCERHPAAGTKAGPDVAVASLSGIGNGGPDDNDGQANRVISYALTAKRGKRDDGESETFVPLSGMGDGKIVGTIKGFGERGWENSAESADRLVVGATSFHMTQEPIHGDEFTLAIGKTSTGMGVSNEVGVRRLTPRECERLQGLPDDWTKLDDKTPDSRRYSALGDAVTATVGEWIGRRLAVA